MRISVLTGIKIISGNEWDSCRYTKGEGFCIDENAQGISLDYTAVFVDDVDAFISQGGQVSEKVAVKRIPHPELTYILDVDSVGDEDIPSIGSANLTPSLGAARRFLSLNPSLSAQPCQEIDDSFTMVQSSVEVEAFRVSSDI